MDYHLTFGSVPGAVKRAELDAAGFFLLVTGRVCNVLEESLPLIGVLLALNKQSMLIEH